MDKTKPDQALSGRPIAKKIVAKMKLHWQRKIVNIKNVVAGHAIAEELQKTVVSQKELEGFHPAHAAYVYAQNQVSVMSEQLLMMRIDWPQAGANNASAATIGPAQSMLVFNRPPFDSSRFPNRRSSVP